MSDDRLAFASNLARTAGLLAQELRSRPEGLSIATKGPQDFVTAADLAVETLIRKAVAARFPADGVLGEEAGLIRSDGSGCWIVDPIDGTTNYMRGLPDWGVSIGYFDGTALTHGVIFAPDLGLMATGQIGGPALLNGRPMQVSPRLAASDSIVTIGYSGRDDRLAHLALIGRLLDAGCEYRRPGAATIGLLAVASGRLEAYYEAQLHIWDAAAGIVLIRAAGGEVLHAPMSEHLTAPCEVLALNTARSEVVPFLQALHPQD